MPVLSNPRTVQPFPDTETARRRDARGNRSRQHLSRGTADAPLHDAGLPGQQRSRTWREQLDVLERASFFRPVELVRLVTVQHVVLPGALLDRALDAETHREQPDAVLPVTRVVPGLIEGEDTVIEKPVERGDRHAVEAQHEQAQPAAIEREQTDRMM